MKSTHTPGPWTVQDRTHVCQAETGSPIANTDFSSRTISGGKANARLIAASPDLLVALESMYSAWPVEHSPQGALLANARAAIAKARGES